MIHIELGPENTPAPKFAFLHMRVTQALYDLVRSAAAKDGITASQWVRAIIINAIEKGTRIGVTDKKVGK